MDKFINGMKFNVRFTFNRLPLKLMHRAVVLAEEHSLNDLLFPSPAVLGTRGTIQPVGTKLRYVVLSYFQTDLIIVAFSCAQSRITKIKQTN